MRDEKKNTNNKNSNKNFWEKEGNNMYTNLTAKIQNLNGLNENMNTYLNTSSNLLSGIRYGPLHKNYDAHRLLMNSPYTGCASE